MVQLIETTNKLVVLKIRLNQTSPYVVMCYETANVVRVKVSSKCGLHHSDSVAVAASLAVAAGCVDEVFMSCFTYPYKTQLFLQ